MFKYISNEYKIEFNIFRVQGEYFTSNIPLSIVTTAVTLNLFNLICIC